MNIMNDMPQMCVCVCVCVRACVGLETHQHRRLYALMPLTNYKMILSPYHTVKMYKDAEHLHASVAFLLAATG